MYINKTSSQRVPEEDPVQGWKHSVQIKCEEILLPELLTGVFCQNFLINKTRADVCSGIEKSNEKNA
jgi:hypothetical protein